MPMKTLRRRNLVAIIAIIAGLAVATGGAMTYKASAPTAALAIATGEYVDGIPVYRLPPVNVTATRSVELAKMAREEALAMSSGAR